MTSPLFHGNRTANCLLEEKYHSPCLPIFSPRFFTFSHSHFQRPLSLDCRNSSGQRKPQDIVEAGTLFWLPDIFFSEEANRRRRSVCCCAKIGRLRVIMLLPVVLVLFGELNGEVHVRNKLGDALEERHHDVVHEGDLALGDGGRGTIHEGRARHA